MASSSGLIFEILHNTEGLDSTKESYTSRIVLRHNKVNWLNSHRVLINKPIQRVRKHRGSKGRAYAWYADLCEDSSLLVHLKTLLHTRPANAVTILKCGNFRFVRDSTFLISVTKITRSTFSPLIAVKRQCFTACTPYRSL